MRILVAAMVLCCAGLGACSNTESTRPVARGPGSSASVSPAPTPITVPEYEDCADAGAAMRAAHAELVEAGSQGRVPAMELHMRRFGKLAHVNARCFPASALSAVPDPDLVDVTPLPKGLDASTRKECKPLVRDAQTLLDFIGGVTASGDEATAERLREGFEALRMTDPACMSPQLLWEFENAS